VLAGGVLARALSLRPLTWAGRISYGLYLWHYPVYWWIAFKGSWLPAPAALAVYVAASFALAELSHRVVERPALRVKHRLAPPSRRGVAMR
jgi:peptidoglycan/LPS O-acetylase OafA/YrhL